MTPPPNERGTALLTVLLLVAVLATIAATAMDRIGLATRLAQNANGAAQARAWLGMAERLAAVRIEDLLAADQSQTTLKGGWMGAERSIALPDGSTIRATLTDGGNCFNLNSLVQPGPAGLLTERPAGRQQFVALLASLGVPVGEADRVALAATDYIDTDSTPLSSGGEDRSPPNAMMVDPSELRTIPGMTARYFRLLERWVCALPTPDLSPINVNTLLPEQAPLLAMLAPGQVPVAKARAALAQRSVDGFGSVINFWKSPALQGVTLPSGAASQVRVRSGFFALTGRVSNGFSEAGRSALFDAREPPVRVVHRRTGSSV